MDEAFALYRTYVYAALLIDGAVVGFPALVWGFL
jgi:hypothetical protein